MKTINRSEIFANAWKLVKEAGQTLSAALKRAWAFAKGKVESLFEVAFDLVIKTECVMQCWGQLSKVEKRQHSSEAQRNYLYDLAKKTGSDLSEVSGRDIIWYFTKSQVSAAIDAMKKGLKIKFTF